MARLTLYSITDPFKSIALKIGFSIIMLWSVSAQAEPIAKNTSEKPPIILYLKGTCCAGKSTLIKYIREKWEQLEIVDGDQIVIRSFPEAVAERFPLEYACIKQAISNENLYHAIRLNDILYRSSATIAERLNAAIALNAVQEQLNQKENLAWRQQLTEKIRKEIIDLIQPALKKGKNVLLDSWYFTATQIQEKFPEIPVVKVLLYSHFPIAYERLLKRNEEALASGNLQEKRYLKHLMGSYCALYQINNWPPQPIHNIDVQELDDVFSKLSQALQNQNKKEYPPIFTFNELSQSEFQKLQEEFLRPFIENPFDDMYITPLEMQDLIIDNTQGDIQKALDSLETVINF